MFSKTAKHLIIFDETGRLSALQNKLTQIAAKNLELLQKTPSASSCGGFWSSFLSKTWQCSFCLDSCSLCWQLGRGSFMPPLEFRLLELCSLFHFWAFRKSRQRRSTKASMRSQACDLSAASTKRGCGLSLEGWSLRLAFGAWANRAFVFDWILRRELETKPVNTNAFRINKHCSNGFPATLNMHYFSNIAELTSSPPVQRTFQPTVSPVVCCLHNTWWSASIQLKLETFCLATWNT